MRWRRNVIGTIGLLVVAGVIGAACGGSPSARTGPAPGARAAATAVPGGLDASGAPVLGPAPASSGGFQLTDVGPKIIKTASVALEIKDGTFEQQSQQVTLVAARHGGFVTTSRTAGGKLLSGVIVIRVPAAQFEVALGELKALGKVKSEQIAGEDVTAQYVDLQARLANWQSQESVLLQLMAKSTSVEDSLKVQQALQDVQLNIEEIKGQLQVLNDQADMSTITLSMAEAQPVPAKPSTNPFVRAGRAAVHGTEAVFTAIVIGLGYMVPVLALALMAGLAWLVVRRIRTRPVASA